VDFPDDVEAGDPTAPSVDDEALEATLGDRDVVYRDGFLLDGPEKLRLWRHSFKGRSMMCLCIPVDSGIVGLDVDGSYADIGKVFDCFHAAYAMATNKGYHVVGVPKVRHFPVPPVDEAHLRISHIRGHYVLRVSCKEGKTPIGSGAFMRQDRTTTPPALVQALMRVEAIHTRALETFGSVVFR